MKMLPALAVRWTFLRGFLRSPRGVGAIAPSSRWLVGEMVDAARVKHARTVVEFGSGTGAVTTEIIRHLPARARLIAFEVDEHFAATLRARITDPRVTIITASAADADLHLAQLGITSVDCVVSSLPLTSLPRPITEAILQTTVNVLRPGGLLVTYQFSAAVRALLKRYFPRTQADRLVFRNLPPAIVFVCPREHEPARVRFVEPQFV